MVKEVNVRILPDHHISLGIQKTECLIMGNENVNEKLNLIELDPAPKLRKTNQVLRKTTCQPNY